MFFDILWGLWWPLGPKLGEEICKFWLPESWIFKWEPQSYMIETSMLACVLTFYRIFDNLQDKNWSKLWQKYRFCLPQILNIQSGALILSWDIFNDYLWWWLKLICKHMFLHIMRFMVISRNQTWWKNMPNIPISTTRILNIQYGDSILCGDVFNDYLWSYMIESDMLACVFNCFCIYGDLQ